MPIKYPLREESTWIDSDVRQNDVGKCINSSLAHWERGRGEGKRAAFTLAEVLITLGIIGVVAALTIPSLMTVYKKHVIETQLKETYSIINQSLKLAEYDYDDMTGWDYPGVASSISSYAWYQKYLQPYLKSSTVNSGYEMWCVWYRGFAVEFINGSGLSCGFNVGGGPAYGHFICMFYPKAKILEDLKDDRLSTRRIVSGKDYFVFEIMHDSPKDKGFQPFPNNSCYNSTGTRLLPAIGCTKLIRDNGWKIPSNYPVKL